MSVACFYPVWAWWSGLPVFSWDHSMAAIFLRLRAGTIQWSLPPHLNYMVRKRKLATSTP